VRLVHLTLRNYRNYASLDLEPDPGLNVFLGANGQGKTNLLESVALLALSSSPRARREMELIGPVVPEARVQARVESLGRFREIRFGIMAQGDPTPTGTWPWVARSARKRIEIDGQPRRALDLPGLFRVSLFWPDDLNLAKGGPEHRRRLLNQMLVQVEPGYAAALARFTRVVEQRNSLLKQITLGQQPVTALDVWDQQMSSLGQVLVAARRDAVAALQVEASATHATISGRERLELAYLGPPEDLPAAIEGARAEDLRRGSSSVGPHRDDVAITIDGRDARSFASQGQQRTAVVSLKLGEASVVAHRTGEPPVLLLDDVLSELDPARRAALLGRLTAAGQVIITSVEADPFPKEVIGRSLVHRISGGSVSCCG
jgi:DNA replication and repair protein RecF